MEKILFLTRKEYCQLEFEKLWNSQVIVVDGIVERNIFDINLLGTSYKGYFGHCNKCGKEIKIRELLLDTFVGCMC